MKQRVMCGKAPRYHFQIFLLRIINEKSGINCQKYHEIKKKDHSTGPQQKRAPSFRPAGLCFRNSANLPGGFQMPHIYLYLQPLRHCIPESAYHQGHHYRKSKNGKPHPWIHEWNTALLIKLCAKYHTN